MIGNTERDNDKLRALKVGQRHGHYAAERNRRMHIYVTEAADKILRSECKKLGMTISDYVILTALSFRADEASKKLDVTLRKLKRYMNRNGIKYSQRRCRYGKKKRQR